MLRLNIKCTRLENIDSYSTYGRAVIDWRRSVKERTGQTQFSVQFAAKLSFMTPWSPVYSFSLFCEISSPMWPNRGFQCRLFLTLQILCIIFLLMISLHLCCLYTRKNIHWKSRISFLHKEIKSFSEQKKDKEAGAGKKVGASNYCKV